MVLIEAQFNGLACVASDRVPDEADISGRVSFVPLRDPDAIWGMKVCETGAAARAWNRAEALGSPAAIRYDIARAAHRLEDFYSQAAGVPLFGRETAEMV